MNNIKFYTCSYCGNCHNGICPKIEEIEYYANGTIKKIRLKKEEYQFNHEQYQWKPYQFNFISYDIGYVYGGRFI